MKLARWEIYGLSLPYRHPVAWASVSEDHGDYVLLRLIAEDGSAGVGEATVKPAWTGHSIGSLAVTLQEVFLPRLVGIDLFAPEAYQAAVLKVPEHAVAKSVLEVACWDLRTQATGQPLWQLLGGERHIPLSWTVTRQAPGAMAREAAAHVEAHGFSMLKIKGGMGIERDLQALAEIRRAVPPTVRLYVDANGAYASAEVTRYSAGLAEQGVEMIEDPCRITLDEAPQIFAAARLPILVDSACRSAPEARAFFAAGAPAVSAKLGKSGIAEARRMGEAARQHGRSCHIGLLGEAGLGALTALSLSADPALAAARLPCEASFFLMLTEDCLLEPPALAAGRVTLPQQPGFDRLVDWQRVGQKAVLQHSGRA